MKIRHRKQYTIKDVSDADLLVLKEALRFYINVTLNAVGPDGLTMVRYKAAVDRAREMQSIIEAAR